ncbi:hypothetical protein BC827DRAFT_1244822 [Russula dissimulans]|nr:hypothetical protein BC827DRAFT_1244822 [Russula dissimulans]
MDRLLMLSIFHLILFFVCFFIRVCLLFLFHVRGRRREVLLYLHAQSKQCDSICGGVMCARWIHKDGHNRVVPHSLTSKGYPILPRRAGEF